MMNPMNVTFRCTKCGHSNRVEVSGAVRQISCSKCAETVDVPHHAFGDGEVGDGEVGNGEVGNGEVGNGEVGNGEVGNGEVRRCILCPSRELFVRKDFPRSLGILIIGVGIVASTVTWAMYRPIITFAILGATALLDLVVYGLVGEVLECYRCRSEYRGVKMARHTAFEMTTYEAHRQHAARLAQHAARTLHEGQSK
jgi:hypothetical protein